MIKRYLLDVNVLAALSSDENENFQKAHKWLGTLAGDEWAICPLTEAGYMRLATNPAVRLGPVSFARATDVLADLRQLPGYRYWPMTESWTTLTAPVADRIFGHQQVTDAYLLGLAIKEDGVLVTFDKGIKYMAGADFSRNVLILE